MVTLEQIENMMKADPDYWFGPYLVGSFIDVFMLGVVFTLFIRWYTIPRCEHWVVRSIAYLQISLNIAFTGIVVHKLFVAFVSQFGGVLAFLDTDYAKLCSVWNSITRLPVASFFAYRAWGMSGRSVLFGGVLILLLSTNLAGGITSAVMDTKSIQAVHNNVGVYIAKFSEVVCDLITTATIAICLWRARTGWDQTNDLIRRLILTVFETQTPPMLLSIAFITLYMARPSSTLPTALILSPKVYSVCFYVVLISKHTLRQKMSGETMTWVHPGKSKSGGTSVELGTLHDLSNTNFRAQPGPPLEMGNTTTTRPLHSLHGLHRTDSGAMTFGSDTTGGRKGSDGTFVVDAV